MDFFEKLGETITAKGKEVTDKVKDLAEVANLKGQISTCEDVIKKNYIEIGKQYCAKHASEEEGEYEEQMRAIRNAQNAIAELEGKIKEIKGL